MVLTLVNTGSHPRYSTDPSMRYAVYFSFWDACAREHAGYCMNVAASLEQELVAEIYRQYLK